MISDSRTIIGCSLFATMFFCCLPMMVFAQSVEAVTFSSSTPIATTSTSQTISQTSRQTSPLSNPDAPYPGCVQQLFKVSGYYSPKQNQQVYTRDTYEQELKLNGRGVHGASGKGVFNGMVAAPQSYAFGTIIVLPGLGIGQVQDRGGAIVNSDGYDRIDVWMGEGDDGIHRAKSIGLRWVLGWYCPGSVSAPVGFDYDLIPGYADFVSVAFWSIDQNIGRSGPLVTKLQSYLGSLGYLMNDAIPGVYDQQMREIVCRFQVDQLGLMGSEDYCGVFGPQTRAFLKKILIKKKIISDLGLYDVTNAATISSLFTKANTRPVWNYQVDSVLVPVQSDVPVSSPVVIIDLNAISSSFITGISFGNTSTAIVVLQKVLAREKFFDHKVTGYFGPVTQDALIQFQMKYHIIASRDDVLAGRIGTATRALLLKRQRLLRFKQVSTM